MIDWSEKENEKKEQPTYLQISKVLLLGLVMISRESVSIHTLQR